MALTTQRKPSAHHRKARGEHHQHNKHYLKAYYPYLPLLLLVIIGLAINSFWTMRPQVLGASTNLTASGLLQTTNLERSKQQVGDLRLSDKLTIAAQAKAADMAAKNYWAHNAPDGTTPWAFINQSGYQYTAAAENLAYGFTNPQSAVTGWMNSPEHRTNILNNNYQDVGFGIISAKDYQGDGPTTIIVALYGQPADPAAAADLASSYTELGNAPAGPLRTVSRVQVMTGGQAPWSYAAISLLCLGGLVIVLIRHSLAWRRVVVKSEGFILHHKMLDVVIISFSVVGFILTRAAGYIQ